MCSFLAVNILTDDQIDPGFPSVSPSGGSCVVCHDSSSDLKILLFLVK